MRGRLKPGKKIGRPKGSKSAVAAEALLDERLITALKSPVTVERLLELRLRKFNLTQESYLALIAEQHGRCALCDEPLTSGWVIDHDHMTMKVRGLVHARCNSLLGFANEDPRRLQAAIDYLKRHNKFLS